MDTRSVLVRMVVVVGLLLPLASCTWFKELQAVKRFKEAHILYQRQDYRNAALAYEEVIAGDPDLTTAYFYLANSYDNLYKPSRRGEEENDGFLNKAIENYKLAVSHEQDQNMQVLSMQYLVAAYGSDKLNDPSSAEPVLLEMIDLDPSDTANYFALAKLYEDAGQYGLAESSLTDAREVRPNDSAVYLQLAGFFNRQGEFERTIEALETRASYDPENPEAYYTIATYFWEKAFRDFRLTDDEKLVHVHSGLDAVEKALDLRGNYAEALVYKNILLRMEANMEDDLDRQKALIAEADELRDRAEQIQKQQQGEAAAGAS